MTSKDTPFFAPLLDKKLLSSPSSSRKTYHLSFDLEGSSISYNVGDSFGIWPKNLQEEVEAIVKLTQATGNEEVIDKKGNKHTYRTFLLEKASLDTIPLPLFRTVLERTKKEPLKQLLEEEAKEARKIFLEMHHLSDFLEETEVTLSPQEVTELAKPLLPRFYSVASSQNVVGHRVDFTVADLSYTTNGKQRFGVCSRHLCHELSPKETVPLFLQPAHNFSLTKDVKRPIIMIGPGTGVAPFRGFLQERAAHGAKKNWLFFGEWHAEDHFFYKEYWKEMEKKGFLRLSTAFSRDHTHKVYVQHRLKEEQETLWEWIEEGGCIYVCGDAKRMAKDVEDVLLEIIEEKQHVSHSEAKAFLKAMKQEQRYQKDVY